MPLVKIGLEDKKTGDKEVLKVQYFMDTFPKNCGYRVLSMIRCPGDADSDYLDLSTTDKRIVVKELMKYIHSSVEQNVKKILISANKNEWRMTYDFIKMSGIQIGEPTIPNGAGTSKVIMGEINPRTEKTRDIIKKGYRLSKKNRFKVTGIYSRGVWG